MAAMRQRWFLFAAGALVAGAVWWLFGSRGERRDLEQAQKSHNASLGAGGALTSAAGRDRPDEPQGAPVVRSADAGWALSGDVVHALTRAGVTPASVGIHRVSERPEAHDGAKGPTATASVDGLGHFAFRGLAPGFYRLDGEAPGQGTIIPVWVVVPATQHVELEVVGTGFLEGHVELSDGGPARGARVLASRAETSGLPVVEVMMPSVVADVSPSGAFAVELAQGPWTLVASLNTTAQTVPVHCSISAGKTISTRLRFPAAQVELSGRVVTQESAPLSGARVSLRAQGTRDAFASAVAGVDGTYKLSAGAGQVVIMRVEAAGFAPEETQLALGEVAERLDFELLRLGGVRGRVTGPSGGVGGATVRVVTSAGDLEAGTDDEGRFALENVAPGEVSVLASLDEGKTSVAEIKAEVLPGSEAQVNVEVPLVSELEVSFRWRCDGPPRAVFLGVRGEGLARFGGGRADASAVLRLALPQGRYTLLPGRLLGPSPWPCRAKSVDVDVQGPVTRAVIEFEKWEAGFKIQVVDASGAPVWGAWVALGSRDGTPQARQLTDAFGFVALGSDVVDDFPEGLDIVAWARHSVGEGRLVPGRALTQVVLGQPAQLEIVVPSLEPGTLCFVTVSNTLTVTEERFRALCPRVVLESVPAGPLEVTVAIEGAGFPVASVVAVAGRRAHVEIR